MIFKTLKRYNITFLKLAFLSLVCTISACSTYTQETLFNTTRISNLNYIVDNEQPLKSHVLAPDDLISIKNLQNPDLITAMAAGANYISATEQPYKIETDST